MKAFFMYTKIHGVRAIIHYRKKILILKRTSSDKHNPDLWDLPGGAIEENETAFSTIKREVLEETGIGLSSLSIKDLHGLLLEKLNGKNLKIAFFRCESRTPKVELSSEHSEYRWIGADELPEFKPGITLRAIKCHLFQ